MMESVFKITGMSCSHCASRVQKAVQDLYGVENCEVNLMTERMIVRYDKSKTGFETFKSAVESIGYGVEPM